MAADIIKMKGSDGKVQYPVTSSEAVGMSDGSGNLDKKFATLEIKSVFKKPGKNLFEPSTWVLGEWLNTNGITKTEYENFGRTGFIPIKEGQTLTASSKNSVYQCLAGLFDKNFNFIQGSTTEAAPQEKNSYSITGTRESSYAAFTFRSNKEGDNNMVEVGQTATYYEPYSSKELIDVKQQLSKLEVLKAERFTGGKNLLDPNGITKDKYIGGNGVNSYSGWCISNYIPLNEGESLTAQSKASFFQQAWEQYDKSLNLIYRSEIGSNQDKTFTTTGVKDSAYGRISFRTQDLVSDNAQIEYGSEATDYEEFLSMTSLSKKITETKDKVYDDYLTDNEEVNNFILEMLLVGTDTSKDYFITRADYNHENKYVTIEISDTDGVQQVRVFTNKTTLENYYFASPQNNSNMWGLIKIRELNSTISNTGINVKINMALATDENGAIATSLRRDFSERDTSIRRNICIPTNFYERRDYKTVWANSDITFLALDGQESEYFDLYKEPIPLAIGESLCVSYSSMFQCNIILINKYRIRLKTSESGAGDSTYVSVTNDTGEDCYAILKVRHSNIKNGIYPQVEYANKPTDYQAYMQFPILENDTPIVLPSKVYLSQGKEANIYKKNIVLANPLDESFNVSAQSSAVTGYPQLLSVNTTNAVTNKVTLYAKKGMLVASSAVREFVNVAKQAGVLTILPIGDSFSDIARWIQVLKEDIEEDGCTLSLIGMKNKTYKNESQTGGTLQNSFLVSRGNAFLLSVTNFEETVTISDGYGAAEYKDVNENKYTFNGRWVDDSGNGYIRISPISHENIPPSNSTLTKTSGNGIETISYTDVQNVDLNPFWDKETSSVSVKKYIDRIEYNLSDKFIMIIQFSFNDNGQYYNTTTISNNIESFKSLISVFHDEYPNAYIIIGIEPASALVGGNPNYNLVDNYQRARMEFAKAIFKEFDNVTYSDYVFINPGYAFVDLENGYDISKVALSSRLPEVLTPSASDGTHCSEAGMFQLGDSYRAVVRHILSL